MDSSQPKEGEPELLSPAARRSQKPQTLAWTTPNSADDDDAASNASTPSEDYQTPSTEHAPSFTFQNPSPKRQASPAKNSALTAARTNILTGSAEIVGGKQDADSGAQIGTQSGQQRRSGGQSYVLQDWPDSTAELAPGIPMPSGGGGSRMASSSSAKSSSSTGSSKTNGRGTTPVGSTSEYPANGTEVKIQTTSISTKSPAASNKSALGSSTPPRPASQSSDRSAPAAQKKTTFAALPNQTTWVKETLQRGTSEKLLSLEAATGAGDQTGGAPPTAAAAPVELSDIRAKMEERRRHIESEKRRLEADYTRQRQQVGKDAFVAVMTRSTPGCSPVSQHHLQGGEGDGGRVVGGGVQRGNVMSASDDGSELRKLIQVPKASNPPLKVEPRQTPPSTTNRASAKPLVSATAASVSATSSPAKNTGAKSSAAGGGDKSTAGAAGAGDVGEYGTSLDRLNSSLTELQGEILRLSLQQDQIKSLVGSEHSPLTRGGSTSSTTSSQGSGGSVGREQFYLFPRREPTEAQSPVGGGGFGVTQAPPANNLYRNVPSMAQAHVVPPPPHGGYPGGFPGVSYQGASMPPHYMGGFGGYAPHQYGLAPGPEAMQGVGRFYLPPSGGGPPGGYPPGMYLPAESGVYHGGGQLPTSYGGGQWPSAPQQAGFALNAQATIPSELFHNHSPTVSQQQHNAQVQQQQQAQQQQIKQQLQQKQLQAAQQQQKKVQAVAASTDSTPITSIAAPNRSNPASKSVESGALSTFSLTPSSAAASDPNSSNPVSMDTNSQQSSPPVSTKPPASEAFYMPLDTDTPSRRAGPPPNLASREGGASRRAVEPGRKADEKKPELATAGGEHDAAPGVEGAVVATVELVSTPAVGFVIGGDDSATDTAGELSELDKRRQRIQELQVKRREELEAKKLQIGVEQGAKSEAERLKREHAEQKKAEDKARREAIFASYLQRKTDEEDDNDGFTRRPAAPTPTPVTRRPGTAGGQRPKQPRPQSQPPPDAGAGGRGPRGLGLVVAGQADGPTMDVFKSTDQLHVGGDQSNGGEPSPLDNAFSFTNLINRRPPTPDRIPKFLSGSSGSEHSDPNSLPVDSYAGPKLFVKPSQKSNKTIIMNAIKDCCLAGSVNQDTKNKVLEEIARSESKHFVILFRDGGQQYRAVYTYNPDREEVFRIHGVGPRQLIDKMMEKFLKYNSGTKTFTEVTSTKHLSATIDAVIITNSLWAKKPAPGQNKKLY